MASPILPCALLCLLAALGLAAPSASGISSDTHEIRVALLPSQSQELDRKLVQLACQIGRLTPHFQLFSTFAEASLAWANGETDAIAGITPEQTILLGGRFLTAYRELRLQAVAPGNKPMPHPADFRSVSVVTLPDGWGTLHARTRGWSILEARSLQEAVTAVREQPGVALMDSGTASLLPQGFRKIDLGISAPVSMTIPAGSPYARGLEAGLESLVRTGYVDRFRQMKGTGAEGAQDWLRKDALVLGFLLAAGAALLHALLRVETGTVLARPNRSILAAGR